MTTLLFSGGTDSALLLALAPPAPLLCVFVDYGQIARNMERQKSASLALRFQRPWQEITARALPPADKHGMIPGRNSALLDAVPGDGPVLIGLNADDFTRPDASREWLQQQSIARQRPLLAPLIRHGKPEILARLPAFGIQETETWSCYGAGPERCGGCANCLQRAMIAACGCPRCELFRCTS